MVNRKSIRFIPIFIFLVCSGCSSVLPTKQPVTLSFMHPRDEAGRYEMWAQEFQEIYPYITVELKSAENNTLDMRVREDAFMATQFELPQLVEQQAMLNLSAYYDQDEDLHVEDFYPESVSIFTSQGKRWAVPFGVDLLMMYYNKDLFDRYGVGYPQVGWTWGDFLDTALQVNDPDENIFAYALHYENEMSIYEPVLFIYQHGGQIFDNFNSPTEFTLDQPLNVEAMEFYASLIHTHNVAPTQEQSTRIGRPYPWRPIFEQHIAMWEMMLSDRGGFSSQRQWDMNWGLISLPQDAQMATMASAEGLFISSTTDNPDDCWLWVSFLSHKMAPNQMPARRSLAESAAWEQAVGYDVAVAARTSLDGSMLVNPDLTGFETALTAMMNAFNRIRSGEATPETALYEAQISSGF
jgi:ABC-type glycerol-3-phosphate transport system substrate-binding protein